MHLGSQYCKQYGTRSDCSHRSSLIWPGLIVFASRIKGYVHLNISSRHKTNVLVPTLRSCVDPGIFARGRSRSLIILTFFFVFFSPQLILQKSNGQFQRNLSFFNVPERVQHFLGGGGGGGGFQLFPGGWGPIAYSL